VKRRPRITIRSLQRKLPLDGSALERFATEALRLCLQIRRRKQTELQKATEISVLLVGNRRMSALHRQFLGQSGATDVLTFQHGEIFINVEIAREQAQRFGSSLEREMRLYLVHGLLHLHGFDDRTPTEAKKMRQVQSKVLRQASRSIQRANIPARSSLK
jgi:probable rRNA maturation factor